MAESTGHHAPRHTFRYASRCVRELFFPPMCAACNERLAPFRKEVSILCPDCMKAWENARADAARRRKEEATNPDRIFLVSYRPGHETGVPERLIYHLKHVRERRVFDRIADELARAVRQETERCGIRHDAVTVLWAPRRRAAIAKDGFDQAELLAKGVARSLGAACLPALARVRTPFRRDKEQKKLHAADRRAAAGRAYRLRPGYAERLKGRCAILVDDLCTTGATLDACAELLLSAGDGRGIRATAGQTAKQ